MALKTNSEKQYTNHCAGLIRDLENKMMKHLTLRQKQKNKKQNEV